MKEKLIAFATRHLNFFFMIMRALTPILRFNKLVIVSRYRDVVEVLDYPNVFGVTYAEKMGIITNGSNFFLGMNNTETYERDVSNMRIVMPRSDVEGAIKTLTQTYANELVADLPDEFDFVSDLSLKVPSHFSDRYIGLPGPDQATLVDWTTYMFWYLFSPEYPQEVDGKAVTYAAEARDYIDGLIQSRKQSGADKNDVIGRCLALQSAGAAGMSDEDIRNNLIGIIIGLVPTTSKCAVLVLEHLLKNPTLLEQAQDLARADDDAGLSKVVLECLRFNNFNPGFFRVAMQDHVLAGGTWRRKKIRQGESVLVLTQSAMMDGRVVDKPGNYSLERPMKHYMPFGYGMHTCFGQYINLVQIPAIIKPVLQKRSVRRVSGEGGEVTYNGPFPTGFRIAVS